MRYITLSILAAMSLGLASTASALTASQQVEKETIVKNADGTETVVREAAEMVVPGERVVYTLNFTNDKPEAASNLVLTMPIPEAITLIDGSAATNLATVTYSADGGNTFMERGAVKITTSDGAQLQASAKDITHVRWLVAGPLSAGETGALSFTGVLN